MNSQSLVNTAYKALKEQILCGNLMPGTMLSENEIADELQMSRTPVRNAITRLETEGFVQSLKNRGILVREISGKETIDMFETTMAMLVYVLDMTQELGIRVNLEKLKEFVQKQIEAEEAEDYLSYMKHSMLFFKAVISSINNQAMLDVMEGYTDKLAMAAYINYLRTPYVKHYSANQLNRSILEALQAGDHEGARSIVKSFNRSVRNRIINGMLF
ncbi:GntR family transcriptional regulator [uncultured Paenibacillus sp.]|uniref:GntR family transcriptional regulator n=1 Tax=uncultured Paenibacillus sp. TaxID=227322 RepID=UPI0015AE3F2F|nr:GntR family transcriptional regulator [uncultured Paenibacillus sp.]